MKKLNKLTHIFIFLMLCFGLTISCGTEEEPHASALTVTVSSTNVQVGTAVTFTAATTADGDLTAESTFFVNGEQIEGNTFTPSTANEANEVYATYNDMTSVVANFASFDLAPGEYTKKYSSRTIPEPGVFIVHGWRKSWISLPNTMNASFRLQSIVTV